MTYLTVASRWIELISGQQPQETAATPATNANTYSSGEAAAPEILFPEEMIPSLEDKTPEAVAKRVVTRYQEALSMLGVM